MKDDPSALGTSLLPQYQSSQAFMERFLVAAHTSGSQVERCGNNGERIKLVDGSELDADVLSYFVEHKDVMRVEFTDELARQRPGGRQEFEEFCDVVANEWFDGKRLRREGRSRRLKRSVLDYLREKTNAPIDQFVQLKDHPTDVEPLISSQSVETILAVNDQMLHRHVEEWKLRHPSSSEVSNDDVFLRRGLSLDNELDTGEPYIEWDFINSYSIAFSAPEKFSAMKPGKMPAIVNGDVALFEGRVLFFSAFIPGMDVGQLEFGIIPSMKPLPIHFQGRHSGVLEYIIDPAPFQK